MFSLTEEQIAFIENDIRVRGITSPDLSIDVLDHICCIIENSLDEYKTFDHVYQETLLLFGDKGLKEIQDETNRVLTFKHYYLMNSTMKISGYVSSLLILFGSIFKFNHWPGASVMLVVGVFFLTVLFMPLLFILKFKASAENNRSVVLSIIGFVAALLICCGVLFRVMHWPGSRMISVMGGVLLILGYLPVYFISVHKNTTNKMNATATIILIIAGVGLFITETGTGTPRPVSDNFWRGVIENDALLNSMRTDNAAMYAKLNSSSDSAKKDFKPLKASADELMNYLDEMKVYLTAASLDMNEEQAKQVKLDDLRSEGANNTITNLLFETDHVQSKYTVAKMNALVDNFKNTVKTIDPSADLTLLDRKEQMVNDQPVAWEKANFEWMPLPLVVYNIIRIELAVKNCERAALNK